MNTFTLVTPSLDCHISLLLNKSIMSMSLIILECLEVLEINVLI
jgi:hypothetical protein